MGGGLRGRAEARARARVRGDGGGGGAAMVQAAEEGRARESGRESEG